ncbi:MAG: alpha/beta fold hydrolase [Anaerolineales bacterium]|nr:alpha/beta fold hydrolase [Anaerolineales bacterium]
MIYFSIFMILAVMAGAAAFWLRPSPSKAATVPPGAKAGDLLLEPCTVKIGKIEYAADCGTLVVPEYRGDPAARLIALPVQRIHSPAQNPAEPIFYLSGGPGTSNMSADPPAWLLDNHDYVKVGYRGVDGTPKLDCPNFADAARGYGDDLLSPESLDRIGEAAAACASALQSKGVDLRGYTIPEVVEDLEAVRSKLGYERVNLLSESYGTRVAQIYAYKHPRNLKRIAMIGVNPPGHFLWLPATLDSQIGQYAELCQQDSACRARTSDLAAAMRTVNNSMPASWMGIPIDSGKVRLFANFLLFHRTTAPIAFDAYLAAEKGDPSGLALMSLAYDFTLPNMMTWGEFLAIGSSADDEPGRDYRSELTPAGSILGAPLSELIWGTAPGNWPSTRMPEEYRSVHTSDIETLLISGSVDFSTPAQFAEQELLPSLTRGRHVVIAEQGHVSDFWSFQRGAARQLLTSFFDTGAADDSLYTYLPMEFKPAMSFPLLAKVLLGTGVLFLVALGFAGWRIIRRIRRGRNALA